MNRILSWSVTLSICRWYSQTINYSVYLNLVTVQISKSVKYLKSHFFFESGPMQTHNRQPFWVQGIWLAPNGHTLAGFAIGTLHLPITAALHLRALYKTKSCSSERIHFSCQPRLKKYITTWKSWWLVLSPTWKSKKGEKNISKFEMFE